MPQRGPLVLPPARASYASLYAIRVLGTRDGNGVGITNHQPKKSRSSGGSVMASLTMAASFLGSGVAAGVAERPSAGRRRMLVVKAAGNDGGAAPREGGEGPSGRRAVMLAVAAAVSLAGRAVALEGEPKRGTPAAKKKYGPICVTMPTASVCHK